MSCNCRLHMKLRIALCVILPIMLWIMLCVIMCTMLCTMLCIMLSDKMCYAMCDPVQHGVCHAVDRAVSHAVCDSVNFDLIMRHTTSASLCVFYRFDVECCNSCSALHHKPTRQHVSFQITYDDTRGPDSLLVQNMLCSRTTMASSVVQILHTL